MEGWGPNLPVFQPSNLPLRITFHVSRFTYDKCPADVRFSDRAPQNPSIRRVFHSLYPIKCPVKTGHFHPDKFGRG